jgi:hypothetical protein
VHTLKHAIWMLRNSFWLLRNVIWWLRMWFSSALWNLWSRCGIWLLRDRFR